MDSSKNVLAACGVSILALAALNVYQWTSRSAPAPAAPAVAPAPKPPAAAVPAPAAAKPTQRQIIDGFTELAFFGVMHNQWFGIKAWQNPMDVWVTQEILWEVKPDFIVETGTFQGGSAVLWATLMEQINPGARVVTVDIEDNVTAARDMPIFQKSVDFLVGSSTDPAIVDDVKRRVEGGRVLVVLDSDHSRDHVLRELELYSPLVPVGSYVIVQDTSANGHPLAPDYGPGPWEAVEAFIAEHPEFEIDKGRERLLFTLHPNGYLKRVR